MTTTFNTMPPSTLRRPFVRRSIIAALATALVVALPGCSLVKLGYGQASSLTFRWLDRYVDFGNEQSLRVRASLDEALAWHRRTQLPDYVQLLARAEAEVVAGDTTPERMCVWAGELRSRIEPVLQYLAPTIADVALTLSPAQLAQIDKRFAETNEDYRDDHLQKTPQRRHKAEVKREVERAEMLYGRLDPVQLDLIASSVSASPYRAEVSYAERQERQQDLLSLLRRLRTAAGGRDDAVEQVRTYLSGLDRSPRLSYRAYAERLTSHRCELASALHNAASAAQRREAQKKLAGYRADLRELMGDAAS